MTIKSYIPPDSLNHHFGFQRASPPADWLLNSSNQDHLSNPLILLISRILNYTWRTLYIRGISFPGTEYLLTKHQEMTILISNILTHLTSWSSWMIRSFCYWNTLHWFKVLLLRLNYIFLKRLYRLSNNYFDFELTLIVMMSRID